jgi:hypothetical protein
MMEKVIEHKINAIWFRNIGIKRNWYDFLMYYGMV